jgi:hypothetical protein
MSTYIVSFEINDVSVRTKFEEKLKSYGVYCPINEFCWAIVTSKKATEIRDFLKPYLEVTDRIFVVRSGTESAWVNTYGEANNDWLKKHL